MTAYSDVPMPVGRLKKAAIDAYMRSSCDSALTEYEVHDDYYMVSTLVLRGRPPHPPIRRGSLVRATTVKEAGTLTETAP